MINLTPCFDEAFDGAQPQGAFACNDRTVIPFEGLTGISPCVDEPILWSGFLAVSDHITLRFGQNLEHMLLVTRIGSQIVASGVGMETGTRYTYRGITGQPMIQHTESPAPMQTTITYLLRFTVPGPGNNFVLTFVVHESRTAGGEWKEVDHVDGGCV